MTPNPPTLVIGDIHHRTDLADSAIARFSSSCERIVFLGDYFDEFGDSPERTRATCRWLRRSMDEPMRTHLIGNHDFSYLLPSHPQAWCPGWSAEKQHVFDEEMARDSIGGLRIASQVGPWLLSHAGLNTENLEAMGSIGLLGQLESAFSDACLGGRSRLLEVGPARGGSDRSGGILWQDWTREFRPTAGFHQIVGHTPAQGTARAKCLAESGAHHAIEIDGRDPRFGRKLLAQPSPEWASVNWCLDTQQVIAGIIEDGRLKLARV
jgi:hypothetical protein